MEIQMHDIFFNKAFIMVKLPYQADEAFPAGSMVPLFCNMVLEEEAQKNTSQFFPRTADKCFALAKLFRFGRSEFFPGITHVIDLQKAIYWHLQSLRLLGEEWNEDCDKSFLSRPYKEALSMFLKDEVRAYVQYNQVDEEERAETLQFHQEQERDYLSVSYDDPLDDGFDVSQAEEEIAPLEDEQGTKDLTSCPEIVQSQFSNAALGEMWAIFKKWIKQLSDNGMSVSTIE
jgi:hypothetical protein